MKRIEIDENGLEDLDIIVKPSGERLLIIRDNGADEAKTIVLGYGDRHMCYVIHDTIDAEEPTLIKLPFMPRTYEDEHGTRAVPYIPSEPTAESKSLSGFTARESIAVYNILVNKEPGYYTYAALTKAMNERMETNYSEDQIRQLVKEESYVNWMID